MPRINEATDTDLKDRLTIGIPAREHDGFTDEELDFIPTA